MKAKASKAILLLIVVGLVVAFFALGFDSYFSLAYLQSVQSEFQGHYDENKLESWALFFALYVATTALSLPGATILTLAGGALFGLGTGLALVSFASTIGATLAFIIARFLFRESVQARFGEKLRTFNEGIERDGPFYLFTLRLVPLFPFFIINLVMGLTPLRAWTFFWVSQLGMLPGTLVYVNAGTQLGQIESLEGILSPELILSFTLLGLFPLLAKKLVTWLKGRRSLGGFVKPRRFDYNLVVIGAGSAGLVTAYIAATVKAKVALIEKNKMGGDCLNTGCVPSKALIRSAKFLAEARDCRKLGMREAKVEFDFAEIMERVQKVIRQIEPHDSVERYTALGVECVQGAAHIRSPYEVEVNGRVLTTRNIVIATGAGPLVPPLDGLAEMQPLTSDTVWNLRQRPNRLLVLGGGAIGSELAQAFHRLGSQVTLVEKTDCILPREDVDISNFVLEKFRTDGIDVRVRHTAKRFGRENGEKFAICETEGREVRIPFDEVLVALGRKPHVTGFGLEELGVRLNPTGTIEADEFLRTNFPNIYVCGDVAGPYPFTHTASHQAWYCAVNALFSPLKSFKADYRVIPWATYTDPEVARVGLNEYEANQKGIPFEVTTYGIDDLDRAIADSADHGLVKVLTPPGQDRILGVTIVGARASDIIVEFITAMKYDIGLNKILGTIHIYPTMAEANKFAAGAWKKAHAPEKALKYLAKFHAWRRG